MLLLATALTAAAYDRNASRRIFEVYPTEDVRDGHSAAVEYDLLVDPDGKLVRCTALRAVGDPNLASKVCALIQLARVGFTRATAPEGTPAYGVIHSTNKYFLPSTPQGDQIRDFTFGPEAEAYVTALPAGLEDPVTVKVVTFIGQDGKTAACEPGRDARTDLAAAACGVVASQEWNKVADATGTPISYVREIEVQFRVDRRPAAGS